MIDRNIPITPVNADATAALRMAVNEIRQFLMMYYPIALLEQTQATEAIAGQWLSRVKGFHRDDDFLHLTRDILLHIQSNGERSLISDQLAYYFSGFMPSYGAACTLLSMAYDGLPWSKIQAFMHSQSYGAAKRYIETFDWKGGEAKAQAEIKAWVDIIKTQVTSLDAQLETEPPVYYAQALPQPQHPPTTTDFPPAANDPVQPKPDLKVVPKGQPPKPPNKLVKKIAIAAAAKLLKRFPMLILMAVPGNVGQKNPELAWEEENIKRLQAEHAKDNKIAIPLDQPQADAETNTTNNSCREQIIDNQRNGEKCENDGYTIMESALQYQRLVDPPKGRGLDGLFEKPLPFDQPNPMPTQLTVPHPGKLIFIPPQDTPPHAGYDYTSETKASMYPKFVVFEAKHIAQRFDAIETERITKAAKNRLGCTYDGAQMSEPWSERRIPQALKRGLPKNTKAHIKKLDEIKDNLYARWMFICLPGAIGTNEKLYILIDVVSSGMDLDSMPARQRKPKAPQGGEL